MDPAILKLIESLEKLAEKVGTTAAILWSKLVSMVQTEAGVHVVLMPLLLGLALSAVIILTHQEFSKPKADRPAPELASLCRSLPEPRRGNTPQGDSRE